MGIAFLLGVLLASIAVPYPSSPQAALTNDNRTPSGTFAGSALHVSLEARDAMWYPDGKQNRGIPMQAFAEAGKAAEIPGPLIRVPAGTIVIANVRNLIAGKVLTMHGMITRPSDRDHAISIPFGATQVIRFRAGAPGTYLYWGTTSANTLKHRFGWDSQLNGALVVDPPGSSPKPNDRIFLISQWINVRGSHGRPNFDYELDTINGRAWPYTERLSYDRGATVHWRWINAGLATHPLHLHGFFFSVDSRGDGLADNTYANASMRDSEITEAVHPGGTFAMTWHADRPGNWLFHCHLSYHLVHHLPVAAMLARKGYDDATYEETYVRHSGMGGLILGITVRARTQNLVVSQTPVAQRIQIQVVRAADDQPDAPSFRYILGNGDPNTAGTPAVGPPIILTRGVSTAIDVTNRLNEPTAIHWHGIELADSYYDGVTGVSGYGNHRAPMIDPGQTFEVRMTPPRAGTFIYHTHMDDIWQLRGGLAGPLIVLEPGQTFDASTDHVFTITTTHSLDDQGKIFVNGSFTPQAITCRVGVVQRFRFINITTFWIDALVSLNNGNQTVQWQPLEMDGMSLPQARRTPEAAIDTISIGQTRDFTFTPSHPGELQVQIWPTPGDPSVITVPVHVVE